MRSFIYAAGAASPPRRGATYPESLDGPPDPLFCLAPDWVYPASLVTSGAVSSYLPISPLPRNCLATCPGRFVFCDTVRRTRLPRRAPAFTGNPALRCPDFPLSLATKRTPTLRNRPCDAACSTHSKQAVSSEGRRTEDGGRRTEDGARRMKGPPHARVQHFLFPNSSLLSLLSYLFSPNSSLLILLS